MARYCEMANASKHSTTLVAKYLVTSMVMAFSLHQSWAFEVVENPISQSFLDQNDSPLEGRNNSRERQFNVAPDIVSGNSFGSEIMDKIDLHGTISHTEEIRGTDFENGTKHLPKESSESSTNRYVDEELREAGTSSSQGSTRESVWWFFETPDLNITVKPKVNPVPLTNPEGNRISNTEELSIEFRTEEHRLILDLKATRDHLASTYDEPQHGSRRGVTADLRCEWQGVVRGLETDSLVAISICPVIRGIVAAGDAELLVEPAPGSSAPEDLHQITSNTPEGSATEGCGVSYWDNQSRPTPSAHHHQHPRDSTRASRERRALFGQHGPLWTEKDTRFIEMVLVADYSFYRHFRDDVYDRCRGIVNIVNAIFHRIGIVVVLTDLEIWTSGDQTRVFQDHNATLSSFTRYREKLLTQKPHINNDNTMLLTTVDFHGQTVGYAFVSGICSLTTSAGVVQDKKGALGITAQTLAHELGHNLGMSHDEDIPGCTCPTKRCIMAKHGSSMYKPSLGWSSCSKDKLSEELNSVTYECLRNVPSSYYDGDEKTCGNGVLDGGEQCDCGPSEFCRNRCCNARTCKLVVNATCATGACCNTETCHPYKGGRVCRESRGECDLPEFCSGGDEYCPSDVHTRDGTSCGSDKGYCYEGTCGNPHDKCRRIWGPGGRQSDRKCSELNLKGNNVGNCGWNDNTHNVLRKCTRVSSECGTLHCQPEGQEPVMKGSYGFGYNTFSGVECYYILGDDRMRDFTWLAPNGSPCGKNKDKMCVDQQCIDIHPANGVTECPKNCNNNGVCNSRGNCHCHPGYAPPDCVNKGHGGSIDSNHINPKTINVAEEVILLLIAIMIPIIAAICCCWEKIRGRWNAKGKSHMSRTCPGFAACLDGCCCPVMSKFTNWFVTVKPRPTKTSTKREMQQVVGGEDASTICQVSLDMKEESQTNSWGVADERLFTEVVRITPKNSPDLSRKIMMPSHAPGHHKSADALDRLPTYQHQSISTDSGCVSDEDVTIHRPLSSQMSMTSLIGAFSRFGNKSVKSGSAKEVNNRSKAFGSQKSIPLSRFVVDPLAGNRSSRHGTPPPDHMRGSFNRSVSTDASTAHRIHAQGPVQPPPAALKPHKSDDNLHKVSKLPKKRWSFFGKNDNPDESPKPDKGSQEGVSDLERKPMLPPHMNSSASTASKPARAAPPLPPALQNKPKEENNKTKLSLLKQSENVEKQGKDAALSEVSSKRPIRPPKFNLTANATDQSNGSANTPPTASLRGASDQSNGSANTPTTANLRGAPIFPPKAKAHSGLPPNTSGPLKGSSNEMRQDSRGTPSESGRVNVKALARKMDQN